LQKKKRERKKKIYMKEKKDYMIHKEKEKRRVPLS
jgi:hypothetical protein